MSSIADIRKDYKLRQLDERDLSSDPFSQFDSWWQEVLKAEITEPNAMTLCTASSDGVPSARIVLLKGISDGGFLFFTNYNSYKAKDLADNPKACLVFFWKELERQVRVTGLVEKTDAAKSDMYFNSRPRASRIGAWSSPQSQPIRNREWLETNEKEFVKEFETKELERPAFWGGYSLRPVTVEFWQGRPNRLHDRLQYHLEEGKWIINRLAP
ncbi:MAG: pyridoxamine 5'-phosphate oxidase [Chitinophagaceae bacterium]